MLIYLLVNLYASLVNVTDTRISVYLGSRYFDGQVEGLCGNYNGKSSDDFGAETSIASSLVDQASAWKTVPSCPEPSMQLSTDPCAVCFSTSSFADKTLVTFIIYV